MSRSIVRRAWFGDVYERGIVGQNRCAITFDDGPLPGATNLILDILKSENVPATFFVIGQNVQRHPELLQRMVREGHIVANHTWSHSHYSMLRGWRYWRREIEQTDAIIQSIVDVTPAWFRPPMGVRTPINMYAVCASGHACIMWTKRGMDGVATTAERIRDRIIPGLNDGAVLLLHDGRDNASRRDPIPTIQALPQIIRAARESGLTWTPLNTLLGIEPYREQ